MKELKAIELICEKNKDNKIFASLGNISKEIYYLTKRSDVFYVLGNMGGIISLTFGYANYSDYDIVSILGDGSLQMGLQSFILAKKYMKKNIHFFIIDNNGFNTTGGQKISGNINFFEFFKAVGIENVNTCITEQQLLNILNNNINGLRVTIIRSLPLDKDLKRVDLNIAQIKDKFIKEV